MVAMKWGDRSTASKVMFVLCVPVCFPLYLATGLWCCNLCCTIPCDEMVCGSDTRTFPDDDNGFVVPKPITPPQTAE